MKLLVFEYICGGGLAGQALPESLLAEGRLMLQALLDELKFLAEVQILLPLDVRCSGLSLPENVRTFAVTDQASQADLLDKLLAESDGLWPIAPETDGVLFKWASRAQALKKILFLSDPQTVLLCSDKLATYACLKQHGIPAVESVTMSSLDTMPFMPAVIKPRDGVGCEGGLIITDSAQFKTIGQSLDAAKYLIQPLMTGTAVSLSCLFKNAQAWLLTTNQQQVCIRHNRFSLHACEVNTDNSRRAFYQDLISRVARAMPGLWGYIGIDLIETAEFGPLILEINPRLTTSYAGIHPAIGINVAEQVFTLLTSPPDLRSSHSQSIRITIQ